MIESKKVGVKLPESRSAEMVETGLGLAAGEAVGEGEAVGVVVGVGVGVEVGVADGVDSKAGPSDAWTIKVLVRVLKIPLASRQAMVILWVPSESPSGGDQFQLPEGPTVISSVIGSDSTVMVKVVLGGPSPKNSGLVLVTTSPSSRLSRVTVSDEGVGISLGTSKPDDGVGSSGNSIVALGISGRFEQRQNPADRPGLILQLEYFVRQFSEKRLSQRF